MTWQDKALIMLGDINVDTIWPVAAIPKPGRDGLVDMVKMEAGGATLNSTIMLDRLDMKTRLLGCVGEDIWAAYLRDALSSTQIDLSAVQTTQIENTGLDFILVTPDGERTMFGYRGANKLLDPEKISPSIFENAALLHISGYAFLESPQRDAVWRAIKLANERDVPISLDTGLEPVMRENEVFRRVLPMLTICITGLAEVDHLLGATTAQEAAEKLQKIGVSLVAIKMGGKGSLLLNQGNITKCPPFDVGEVDTTGAGDAYSAGIIAGYTLGLSSAAMGMLASALGAMAVMVEGAGFSLPKKSEVHMFLDDADWPDGKEMKRARSELIQRFHA